MDGWLRYRGRKSTRWHYRIIAPWHRAHGDAGDGDAGDGDAGDGDGEGERHRHPVFEA